MFKLPNVPLSTAGLWSASVKLYVKSIFPTWFFALFLVVVSQVSIYVIPPLRLVLPGHQEATAVALVFFVNILLLSYFMSLVLHYMYTKALTGEKVLITNSIKFVWDKYATIVVAMIIYIAICLLGMMLLIIPGIFFSILFIFTMPAILFANKKVISALKYSAHLVWGKWWQTFFVMAPPLAVMYLLSFVIALRYQDNLVMLLTLNIVIFSFCYPLLYALVLMRYNDLVVRNEIKLNK
jgi:hypothetical protein